MEIAGFWNKITLEIGGKYEYKVICTSNCPDLLVEEEEEEKSLKWATHSVLNLQSQYVLHTGRDCQILKQEEK